MSLSIALQNALSGLQVSKTALDVISSNVANVNTEGYTRKIANLQTAVVGGEGRGVQISSITRNVNDILVRNIRTEQSASGKADVENDFFARTQELFGTLGSNSSLGTTITNFSTALNAAAATPENMTLRTKAIDAAVALTRQLNDMSAKIQSLRSNADQEISNSLTTVNQQIATIADLNIQINRAATLHGPYGDLLDKRDQALNTIAKEMDVTSFERDAGSLVLMTGDGRVLADLSTKSLSHLPAAALDASVSYPASIDGIKLDGADISASITSGRLAGLINMRDKDLPNLQTQLDSLATTLKTEINKLHNAGAGSPPAGTLTGTATVTGGGAAVFSGTGIARIAVVKSDGTFASAPFDLNLASVATVGGLVSAINTNLAGYATASLNANNQLVITADNTGDGVAINENTSSVGGIGLSSYFGLNDFFVGSSAVSLAGSIAVRSDIATSPQLLSSGTLNNASAGGITAGTTTAVGPGDGTALQAMMNAFHTSYAFSASGGLPAVTTTIAEYSNQILADNASKTAAADDNAKYHTTLLNDIKAKSAAISGVNMDEELSNLIIYQTAYAAAARVVTTASEMMDILERMMG
ncbi:MAG: flagellar hook-associated protein FlgK [Alphaproteobacteria bacterium]